MSNTKKADQQMRVEQLVLEHAKIDADIKALTERKADLKAQLAELFEPGDHPVGEHVVQVTCPRRFDEAAFTKAYPVVAHPEFYVQKVNMKAIAPALVDEYRKPGNKVVTIKDGAR